MSSDDNVVTFPTEELIMKRRADKAMDIEEENRRKTTDLAYSIADHMFASGENEPEIMIGALIGVIGGIIRERPELFGPTCEALRYDFVEYLMEEFDAKGIDYE